MPEPLLEAITVGGPGWQHEKLLADEVRISAYCRAIEKYVDEGDVVIDLGTGTGVLAFMAAEQFGYTATHQRGRSKRATSTRSRKCCRPAR
ncbi:MAG: hypothetical protein ACE5HQ_08280 [Gemmatimonadota bacterium]